MAESDLTPNGRPHPDPPDPPDTPDRDPRPRQWSYAGSPAVPAIDSAVTDIMGKFGVRGASLAIVRDTKLILARAYNWTEPGAPKVSPTTRFRQASCSKLVTALAIHQLIEEGSIGLGQTVQSILQLKTPTGDDPIDGRFASVTIRHLLEHTSGLVTTYSDKDVAI